MKKITASVVAAFFLCGILAAQDMSGVTPPPKVLTLFREYTKPGRAGSVHEKSESAFISAVTHAKYPTRYLAVTSLSGRPRALFLTGYDSFDAWEKDIKMTTANATLSAALDKASMADGDLLSDVDQSVLTFDEEFSLRPNVDIAHMRYFEISLFRLKPGHRKDWADLVKLVMAAYEKMPDMHWATYELAYGQMDGPVYVVFSPQKAAADIDKEFAADKDFVAAMGADGMKKLTELEQAAIEASQSNLFAFSPKMSYPPDEWIKADPEFWKPKPAAMAAPKKPAAEKPAQ